MQCCIKDCIGHFLIWEDPGLFAAADAFPHAECFGRFNTPELMITYNTAQEPDIRGPDAVVVVQIQTGQCTDKDAVNGVLGDSTRELRVQGVDAFEDQDVIRTKLQRDSLLFPVLGLE